MDPDEDVEIEAKLDQNLLSGITQRLKTITAIAEHLREPGLNKQEDSLLSTENWFALYVKQSVPLPPEFGEGKLKVGYSTSWAKS